ncbi:MAG: dihydrolipoamide acetyltransferase family protein [Oligoflexus sp.]
MPSLGADMDFGILVQWHVKPGDQVQRGDVVAEVETEKGVIEVEIWQSGTIGTLIAKAGEKIPVGAVLAIIDDKEQVVETKQRKEELSPPVETILTPDLEQAVVEKEPRSPAETPAFIIGQRPAGKRVSPLARKLAVSLGVDLASIDGTGEGGAIVRADIERVAAAAKPSDQRLQEDKLLPTSLSAMRRAIGRAMLRSKREIPHYYLQTEILMEQALSWLQEQNQSRPVHQRLLPAALLIKATSLAAKEFPDLNGFWQNEEHIGSQEVHIGVASSLRQGGLVAPVIHHADRLAISDLMTDLLDLVNRARIGKLRSSDLDGATITVTNLGDRGVDSVFGVIHPPQLAIIGFGRIRQKPWAENGMIGAKDTVIASLSADHRASDGHRGGLFLESIARSLQDPEQL